MKKDHKITIEAKYPISNKAKSWYIYHKYKDTRYKKSYAILLEMAMTKEEAIAQAKRWLKAKRVDWPIEVI